jgi:hypothetical protein
MAWVTAFSIVLAMPQAVLAKRKIDKAENIIEAHRTQVVDALQRGKRLYEYDQAAWHTTDTLREDIKDLENSGIKGWVVTAEGAAWRAIYFGISKNGPFGIYTALWDGKAVSDRKVLTAGTQQQLSAEQLRLISVQQIAKPAGLGNCSRAQFNSVILPSEKSGDPDSVYYLTPQTENSAYPFGGHHRIDVKDGKIVARRSFTKACMTLSTEPQPGSKGPSALVVTHMLDPVPTEIHVFSVFASKIPLYVLTTSNNQTWAVEVIGAHGRVRLITSKDAQKGKSP